MAAKQQPGPSPVDSKRARLRCTRDRMAELDEAMTVERQRRDDQIEDLISDGSSWAATAADAGVSEATVHRVLARD